MQQVPLDNTESGKISQLVDTLRDRDFRGWFVAQVFAASKSGTHSVV